MFDPGNPVISGDDLIEDDDGAPLPHELQRDGAIWRAVYDAVYANITDDDATDAVNATMRALAPILWPLLPSNDRNAYFEAVRAVPNRTGTPEWDNARDVGAAMGYDIGLATARDAICRLAHQ